MKYPDYENAFSAARLNRFLKACRGDKVAALTLYRHNVKLCQKFYGVLNIFEVVFPGTKDLQRLIFRELIHSSCF